MTKRSKYFFFPENARLTFKQKIVINLKLLGYPQLIFYCEDATNKIQWDGKQRIRGEISFFPPIDIDAMQSSLTAYQVALNLIELHNNWKHI